MKNNLIIIYIILIFNIIFIPNSTSYEQFNFDVTEVEINWTTTHLANVMNPFDQEMDMINLRGEITDWIVYYDQTPWGDKNLDEVNRITFPHDEISKEFLGNNTYQYELSLTPEFEGNNDIFLSDLNPGLLTIKKQLDRADDN